MARDRSDHMPGHTDTSLSHYWSNAGLFCWYLKSNSGLGTCRVGIYATELHLQPALLGSDLALKFPIQNASACTQTGSDWKPFRTAEADADPKEESRNRASKVSYFGSPHT